MGILSKFLKPKPAQPESEDRPERSKPSVSSFLGRMRGTVEEEERPEPPEKDETPAVTKDATDMRQERNISFGVAAKNPAAKTPSPSSAPQRNINIKPSPEINPHARKIVPVKAVSISDREIAVEFNDILPQIPENLLKSDAHAAAKPLLFSTYELLPGLSHGKVTVPLARIANLAPDQFKSQPAGGSVELPLQKIVAQIGEFPGRPDQVEEIREPLDARYAKLILEKGGAPVTVPREPAAPAPKTEKAAPPAEVIPEETPEVKAAAPEPVESQPAAQPAMEEIESQPEPTPEPVPEPAREIENVTYSLAAIFPNVPKPWISGDLKSVDDAARITVPFHLVDTQLASGKVELAFTDFIEGVPGELKKYFSSPGGNGNAEKVLIPLHEVFQNLPGSEPPPPPRRRPRPEPVEEVETAQAPVIEEPAPQPVPTAEPEAKVQPAPKEEPAAAKEEVIEQALVEPKAVAAEPAATEAVEEKIQPVEPEVPAKTEMPAAEVAEIAPTLEPAKVEEPVASEQAVEPPAPEPAQVEAAAQPAPHEETPRIPETPGAPFMPPIIQLQRLAPSTALLFADRPPVSAPPETLPAEPVEPVSTSEIVAGETATDSAPPATGGMFTSHGKFDSKKTIEHLILLPGIKAAAITIKGKTRSGGEMPANFNVQETGKAASALFHALEGPGAVPHDSPRILTLHHDGYSSTFFKQGAVLLCVIHPGHSPGEETHHALVLAMRAIAQARQH